MRKHHGEFELTRLAEAAEYRKTLAILEEERAASPRRKAAVSAAERAVT
ncbi:hypothetical protein [Pyxidicoccus sp. MSG2]|nr:hypothetical protein [Pyxidicoccus sp. MSG2]MCY1020217.1 hypothetical protein [Pyxidicoccus sp. MSG2]